MSQQFLVEIGCEELPPTSLNSLSGAFADGVARGLSERGIAFSDLRSYATPRRLAITLKELASHTPLEKVELWGPPAKVAFDADGKPTKAAEAFAKKAGVEVDALERGHDGKQEKLRVEIERGGDATAGLIGGIVRESLDKLPIAKRMRWGDRRDEFVRPVQWIVMMLDDQVLDESVLGHKAGRVTYGHRFHHPEALSIASPEEYASRLENEAKVIADMAERRRRITEQVTAVANAIGGRALIEEALLDEVAALVEWPVAHSGGFDREFLQVPQEALISSMQEHQKYFPVVDERGALLPHFIFVANLESADAKQVVAGNERVIRPRLADAAFFFNTDRESNQTARREKLKAVTFQAKLGSVFDKTERIAALATWLAPQLDVDPKLAEKAAALSKSDLVSSMVFEFPELQGIAGAYYCEHDGEEVLVAAAMKEQYLPKYAGDAVPAHDLGAIIGIADRIDTLVGIFGLGQKPTGSKDPFALRRASVAVLRLLIDKAYGIDLRALLKRAVEGYSDLPKADTVVDDVIAYVLERLYAVYADVGIRPEIVNAVLAKHLTEPLDIDKRVQAVASFAALPEASPLAEANKRVSNILAKENIDNAAEVDAAVLAEEAEKTLYSALEAAQSGFTAMLEKGDYTKALCSLASLKTPVDHFFDHVMVMCEDPVLRANRLALLSQLRASFLAVADISQLVVKAA